MFVFLNVYIYIYIYIYINVYMYLCIHTSKFFGPLGIPVFLKNQFLQKRHDKVSHLFTRQASLLSK